MDEPIIKDDDAVFEEKAPEDKTPEGPEKEPKEDEETKDSSLSVQKKKWRDRALKAEEEKNTKVATLEKELADLKSLVKKPTDDQEAKAQEYIRTQARTVFEELQAEKKRQEQEEVSNLNRKIEDVLEDNPDISREELLDAVEEYEVEPSTAAKILLKQATRQKKPKMPAPKRASASDTGTKPDDKGKSMFQIAREEIERSRQG